MWCAKDGTKAEWVGRLMPVRRVRASAKEVEPVQGESWQIACPWGETVTVATTLPISPTKNAVFTEREIDMLRTLSSSLAREPMLRAISIAKRACGGQVVAVSSCNLPGLHNSESRAGYDRFSRPFAKTVGK